MTSIRLVQGAKSTKTSAIPRPSCGLTGASEARLAQGTSAVDRCPGERPGPGNDVRTGLTEVRTVAGLPFDAFPYADGYGDAVTSQSPPAPERSATVQTCE